MFKRFGWVFVVMLPVGAMVGFLAAAVVTYVMPKQYESQAVIEVKASPSLPEGVGPRPIGCGVEFNLIQSSAFLAKVVAQLDLTNRWGVDQEAAIRILKEIVSTENIRGTDLIGIRVRHTDREGARDIAAEVARTYRDYRVEIQHRDSDYGLAELNKAVREQEEKVEERRKIYAKLMRNMGPHPSILMHDESSDTSAEAITRAQDRQDIIDAKRDFETDQALLKSMKLEQVRATIEGKIPNDSVVIHEEPQIGDAPVSPNVTLNLILGAVGGFLLSPLLALPLMLLLNRLISRKESGASVHLG